MGARAMRLVLGGGRGIGEQLLGAPSECAPRDSSGNASSMPGFGNASSMPGFPPREGVCLGWRA